MKVLTVYEMATAVRERKNNAGHIVKLGALAVSYTVHIVEPGALAVRDGLWRRCVACSSFVQGHAPPQSFVIFRLRARHVYGDPCSSVSVRFETHDDLESCATSHSMLS